MKALQICFKTLKTDILPWKLFKFLDSTNLFFKQKI